jgi:hypothetical protein
VSSLSGPTSYVISNPYSIALSLATMAQKLGAMTVSLKKANGNIVRPDFASLSSGLNERLVSSSQTADGKIEFAYNGDLNMAAGPNAWPYMVAVTLIVPKRFTSQSCIGRRSVTHDTPADIDGTRLHRNSG